MDSLPLDIDPDIRSANTLPIGVYTDPALFERLRERVFARTWHIATDVADLADFSAPGFHAPGTLLPGLLDEPLLFARDESGRLAALSNVCTHRNALLCETPGRGGPLRCRYHGRRFGLDGRLLSAPGFEGATDFPRPADDLRSVPFAQWKRFLFASTEPAVPFESAIAELAARLDWLPFDRAEPDPSRSRDYELAANWALWCDNYLEGFHVPFVHPTLAPTLDAAAYATEVHTWSNLQIGIAAPGEEAFQPPPGTPEHGRRVGGYYAWLFPGTAFNCYPWGVSMNIVHPLAHDRTSIRYRAYVWDESKLERGAGAGLDQVEMEDQAIVASAWRGVRSRAARRGRYAPRHEACVHHFHRLLLAALHEGADG